MFEVLGQQLPAELRLVPHSETVSVLIPTNVLVSFLIVYKPKDSLLNIETLIIRIIPIIPIFPKQLVAISLADSPLIAKLCRCLAAKLLQ